MMNSKSISTEIQTLTQFNLRSNLYKNAFNPSPSPNLSFNLRKKQLNSIRKTCNLPPKAAASNGFCTQSPEETLYDLLAIPQSGTLSDIKRAYKQMALKYHPDVSPPDQVHEYTERFIRVQEAYKTLSNPESRADYDCNLAKGLHLAFLGKKGSPLEARSEKMAWWKQSWEVQMEELRRRSTMEMDDAGRGGWMSWAARIRKERQHQSKCKDKIDEDDLQRVC